MFKFIKEAILVLCLLVCGVDAVEATSNCYIRLSAPTGSVTINQVTADLAKYGGRVVHYFPPDEIICSISLPQLNTYLSRNNAFARHAEAVEGFGSRGADKGIGEICWESLQVDSLQLRQATPDTIAGDSILCGTEIIYEDEKTSADFIFPDRTLLFNANYLVGSAAVCLMLMESDGSYRNWTTAEEDTAIAQVVVAYDKLSWLAYWANVDVRWVYEIHRGVPTGYEPIFTTYPRLGFLHWEFGWIDDAMDYLGSGSEWDGTHANANRVRQQYQTDWGFTYFVVKNSYQEVFPDTAYGYTRTYSYDIWQNLYYSAAFAVSVYSPRYGASSAYAYKTIMHETLHVFGATDEYTPSDQCDETDDCDRLFGYLNHPNVNCQICGGTAHCIMKDLTLGLCTHTRKHIGWTDSDGDGQPDAIDPNSSVWAGVGEGAQPGDLVRMFTLNGGFLRAISATDLKLGASPDGISQLLWDGLNYDAQDVLPLEIYFYVINNGSPQSCTVNPSDPGASPIVVTSCSYSLDTLRWEVLNSFHYLTLDVYAHDRTYNDTFLLARPQWNQYHFSSDFAPNKKQDMSGIDCAPCFARFTTWRPDGALGNPVEYEFSTYTCGDMNGDTAVDISDLNYIVAYLFGGGPPIDPQLAGDIDCSGGIDISDLSYLVEYLFEGGPEPMCCW